MADCTICSKLPGLFSDTEKIPLEVCKGLCQKCYLARYVAPLQKERDNSQRIIDALNGDIKARLDELGRAQRLAATPPAKSRVTSTAAVAAGIATQCDCGARFTNWLRYAEHRDEGLCVTRPKGARHSIDGRTPKAHFPHRRVGGLDKEL